MSHYAQKAGFFASPLVHMSISVSQVDAETYRRATRVLPSGDTMADARSDSACRRARRAVTLLEPSRGKRGFTIRGQEPDARSSPLVQTDIGALPGLFILEDQPQSVISYTPSRCELPPGIK